MNRAPFLRFLSLIASVSLAFGAPYAGDPKEPQTSKHGAENRKSAWKVHVVQGGRAVYRRGGEILVQLQPGVSHDVLSTRALTSMIGGMRTFGGGLEAVTFDEESVDFATIHERLLATAGVLRAEPNILFSTQGNDSPGPRVDIASNQWHLQGTPGHARLMGRSHAPLPSGRATRVGVMDTGVDYTHEEFAGRTRPGVNLISHPLPDEDPESAADLNGHGTRVAGIVAAADDGNGVLGINPRAELLSIKVFNRDGDAYLADVVAGIDWAIAHRIQVLNMSFGTYERSEFLEQAIERARGAGILLIAAAGNDAAETAMFPAAFPGVLSVGAYDGHGETSAFSNWGSEVDFHAPGDEILTTDLWRDGYYPYTVFRGTSAAAAYVTGVGSLLIEQGTSADATADLLRDNVVAHANESGDRNPDPWLNSRLILSHLLHEPYSEVTIVSFKTGRSIFQHADDVSVGYEVQNTGRLPTKPGPAWLTVREGEASRRVTLSSIPRLGPGERHRVTTVVPVSRFLGQADASDHRLRVELALGDFPEAVTAHRRLLVTETPRTTIRIPALWASPLDFKDADAERTLFATVENAGRAREEGLTARAYAVAAVHEGVYSVPKIDLGTIEVGSLAPGETRRLSLELTNFTPPDQRMTFWLEIQREGQRLARRLQAYRYAGATDTATPQYAEWVHQDIADEAIKLLESQGIYIPDLQNPQYRGQPSHSNSWPVLGGLPTGTWWYPGYWSDAWLASDPAGAGFFGLALSDLTLVDGANDCDFVDVAFGYSEEDTFDSHFWIVDTSDDNGLDSGSTNHHSALTKLRALLYGDGTTHCAGGCPGAGPATDLHLFHGAIDHYLEGHKQAAWWFLGHAVHLVGDLSVPSHVDNENLHGVYGATYHFWMDDDNNSLWSYVQARQQGGYVDPYDSANAGDPLRYLAYTTAQLGNSFPWASLTLGTTFGSDGNRTAGGALPHYDTKMPGLFAQLDYRPTAEWHVQKDEIFDYKPWDYGCDLVDFIGVSEYHEDCWDHDGHADWDNTDDGGNNVDGDLYRIGRVNYPYAIRAAAGLIYYFAVQTGQITPNTLIVTDSANSGPGTLRDTIAAAPAGYTIRFAESLDGATISLASQLLINKDLTIDASALPNGLTVTGNGAVRVFEIGSGRTVSIVGLTITRGYADYGGGIRNNGTLALADANVISNFAVNQGGGIYNYFGNVTLRRVTMSSNITNGQGGAIWAAGATTYVENSTIQGNLASYHAGIANENGTVTVVHSTITGNSASAGGGYGGGLSHLQFGSATTIVENSIVAQNSAASSPDVYKNTGSFTPTGPNLIGVNGNASTEFPAGPLVGTPAGPLNPQLHPLMDNGGPTLTRAPIPGSPAIDAAVLTARSPLTDQRGSYRAGGPDNDLGTVELSECGNGVLRAGEACDDGNYVNGDCCSVYCTYEAAGTTCDADGSVCTDDVCDGSGSCAAGAALDCNDGNVCTDDACNAATGCQNIANAATTCDDGNWCTTADTCSAGVCVGGPPPPVPFSVPVLQATDSTTWTWTPDVDAAGYDLVKGDLGLLRASGGNFVTSTTDCLGNDMTATTQNDAVMPTPGSASFVLVRAENCMGSGTYDSGGAGQAVSRDAGIDAAAISCALGACPCWPGGPQEIAARHLSTHPLTTCSIGSGAPTPDRSYTALFSYNDAVHDEYATQVFKGYSGRPAGQDYCQSYNSCYVIIDTCAPNGCYESEPCDPSVWSPPADVDMAITPGEKAACIEAFQAAQVILGCN